MLLQILLIIHKSLIYQFCWEMSSVSWIPLSSIANEYSPVMVQGGRNIHLDHELSTSSNVQQPTTSQTSNITYIFYLHVVCPPWPHLLFLLLKSFLP